MKISFNNQINFGKQLKANCTVLKDEKQLPCKIYELTLEDIDYFCNKERSKQWKGEKLWDSVIFDFGCNQYLNLSNFYVLEDENNNCLAFADINKICIDEEHDGLNLSYFAAQPNHKENGYKYIGETFINFLCGLAKKGNYEAITVSRPLEKAMPFYSKCKFKPEPILWGKAMCLRKDMEELIAQNEEHTGHKIDYIF